MEGDYQFYMETNVDKYIGKWIAICEKKVISSGRDVKKVFREAKEKCGNKTPFLAKVPDKQTMIF